ncbi:sensor histidine kinase [Phosphitispora sp. TUW77]|uniref:sensor histidine kinase n=1 Tax=Phosphitispora sp. TUW77 TaxID=3152361 RepID=UPI003AB2BE0D
MKQSLRTRLFLSITLLIIFFVIATLLVNSLFLGKFYVSQKRAVLLESRDRIVEIYNGDPENISFELENLERNKGLTIYIVGPDFYEFKYNSALRKFNPDRIRIPREHLPLELPFQNDLQSLDVGEYFFNLSTDPRLKTKFLVLASKMNNQEFLLLSTPIAAINESVVIANRFLLFTGILTAILGGIAVYLFSGRFTKPILDLSDIARKMSALDFSVKYPVKSDDEIGQLGHSINSLSDQLDKAISELQEANAKLREDIERERMIDKMRKDFISSVSHELKTPIALIQGYAEGLKLNVNEDEESRNFYCDVIMDETGKMNTLVKDLLDLSQIESGYFKLDKSDFDISLLVERVLDKYQPVLQEKGIIKQVDKRGSPLVNGDKVRIEQVLVNYLNNAIDHVDEARIIRITIAVYADKVRVSVFNSGKPIPDESLDKIWSSFYKVDKARTRAYGGTGLGLSVVKAIMELHNNSFGVANMENGVKFWFEVNIA